jgi:hypothetical protein
MDAPEGMIGVREAVRIAKEFLSGIYAEEEILDVGLEEVKFEEPRWAVTLGFRRPWSRGNLVETLGGPTGREYKRIQIDGATGRVLGMEMRRAA